MRYRRNSLSRRWWCGGACSAIWLGIGVTRRHAVELGDVANRDREGALIRGKLAIKCQLSNPKTTILNPLRPTSEMILNTTMSAPRTLKPKQPYRFFYAQCHLHLKVHIQSVGYIIPVEDIGLLPPFSRLM